MTLFTPPRLWVKFKNFSNCVVVEDENVEDENWDTLPMTPPNLRNQISLSMKSFCADPSSPTL
jgi:hypothetical protein